MAETFSTVSVANVYDLSSQGSMKIGGIELEGFKSGNLSFEGDSVDNSTREAGGWACDTPGKRSCTLEVTCNKKASSTNPTCQNGLRALMLGSSGDYDYRSRGVEIQYMSAPLSSGTSAGTGFSGKFILVSMSEAQQMGGEAVEITYSFKNFGPIVAY